VTATLTEAEELALLGRFPSADVPAVLLPVRVETRFAATASQPELWVRVYPDEVHVDTHEPELTADEVTWGEAFWVQTWRSGAGADVAAADRRRQAWELLVQRFGAERAAWVATALTPTNPGDRPPGPTADGTDLPTAPRLAAHGDRLDAWTRPPLARLLPERWVAIASRGGRRVALAAGAPIPADLHAGPDPAAPAPPAFADDELVVDDGMRWLVDFAAAEAVGMAIRVPITPDDAQVGFDTLLVVGLRTTPDPGDEAAAIEDLLAAHRYTDGVELGGVGTPTNNTDAGPSAHAHRAPQVPSPLDAPGSAAAGSSAALLAAALGIDGAAVAPLAGAAGTQTADAAAMQALLWPATGGYFLEQLFTVMPVPVGARQHVVDHVRPEGPLPLLRIARQPYGVLPVSSFDRWPGSQPPPPPGNTGIGGGILTGGILTGGVLTGGVIATDIVGPGVERAQPRPQPNGGGDLRPDRTTDPTRPQPPVGDGPVIVDPGPVLDPTGGGGDPPPPPPVPSGPPEPLHLLHHLRDTWRHVADHVPRLDRRPTAALAPTEADILAVLRGGPSSAGFDLRLVFDRELFGVPGLHSQIAVPPELVERQANVQALLGALGVFGEPRVVSTVLAAQSADVRDGALVAPPDAPQGDAELLAFLRTSPPAVVRDETGLTAPPGHLLYLVARHAVLLTYAAVATAIQQAAGDATPATDPAIVDIMEDHTPTVGRRIDQPLPGITTPLEQLTAGDHPAAAALDDMRAALDHLATLAPDRLAAVLAGTLDVFSYRLDAWLTSLATRRLADLRTAAPTGAVVGGYGWLEDVRPRPPATAAPTTADEPGPLVTDPLSAGFVHAPSMGQAATAAVLRSGFIAAGAPQVGQTAPNPFAVDLSSRRVRLAAWLLDGVRQGQELGSLLGQRFERGLHDHGLDRYIAPFRTVAPFGEIAVAQAAADAAAANADEVRRRPSSGVVIVDPDGTEHRPNDGAIAAADAAAAAAAQALEVAVDRYRQRRLFPPSASVESMETAESASLVDGLALARSFDAGTIPWGTKGLPAVDATDQPALFAELAGLSDALDAIADALTAEGVHQLVMGNPERAGASLDAVARREVPPPELEFARTPRTGTALTHRAIVLTPPSGDGGWPSDGIRARAEPSLHRWAAGLLGDPRAIRVDVRWTADGTAATTTELRLATTGLGSLDLLAMVDEAGAPRPELAHYLAEQVPAPAGAQVDLLVDRGPDWPADVRSLAEALEVARAANELLAGARALRPDDLAPAGTTSGATVDAADLAARADALVAAVRSAQGALTAALAGGPVAGLRTALSATLFAGSAEAMPAMSVGDDPGAVAELRTRATAVGAELGRKLDAAATASTDPARITAILGNGFSVLPRLTMPAGNELARAFADGPGRFGGDVTAPSVWVHRAADVRRNVERLQTVLLYAAAAGRAGAFAVAQLPFTAGERWVALAADPGATVAQGRTSIVAHTAAGVQLAGAVAGLFVDEWVEVVPNATEVTGVACNVDEPASQPPQSVLIAVAPPGEPRWGIDLLEAILLETLDLAHLRAVTPEQIAPNTDLEQVLPALYFGLNLHGDTVSTDFRRVT
jgi:hypothetical protein